MMALMVAIYSEWVESVYHRSDSILITPYMIVAIAPLFSFFLTAYFSFAILYHINKRETAILVVLRLVVVFGIAFLWIFLCNIRQISTLLMRDTSSYFALLASIYSIVLVFLQERKEKSEK